MIQRLKGPQAFCFRHWRPGIAPTLRYGPGALADIVNNALFTPEQPAPPSKRSFLLLSRIVVTLDVQRVDDSGSALASAADVAGTWVPFNVPFISASVQLTPQIGLGATTWAHSPLEANPTGFYAFFWDSAGNRVSGPFSWAAGGN